jgi:hypothetical protein
MTDSLKCKLNSWNQKIKLLIIIYYSLSILYLRTLLYSTFEWKNQDGVLFN